MSKKDGRKLQEDWLKDPSCKEWLKNVSDLSHKTLSLSTAGRASLTKHDNGAQR